jgi:hypothetical protein
MQRGSLIFSAIFHVALLAFVIIGLPQFFAHKPLEDTPIAVQLVTLSDKTQATAIAKAPPKPDAKPEPQVAQATPEPPKPEPPKPEPPKAAPPPPPPPPKPPEPEAEAKPEPKPAPPAPPPPAPPEPPKETPEPKPEPPKVEPKPEPPKPAAEAPKPKAKPEPPKQVAKNESKETQKQDSDFSSLLKNLTKQKTAPSPQDATPKSKSAPAPAQASSQPMNAPLGSQLTVSERDLIVQQIESCWNVPAGAKDAQNLIIDIHIDVASDRTVTNVQIVDQSRYNSDPFFRAAADSARRAIQNPRCSPLKLPADKYDQWKSITLSFNPKDVT